MTDINLDGMDLSDLKTLEKKVAKAIASFENRRKTEARAAAKAKANDLGFTLSALMDSTKTKAPKRRHQIRPPTKPNSHLDWSRPQTKLVH